uniref:Protein MODIFIER OF SNC1 11 n=1 Tax=Rhizophora mucronata TaxID=61149 RepID=A0A2P2K6T1_RHIMU
MIAAFGSIFPLPFNDKELGVGCENLAALAFLFSSSCPSGFVAEANLSSRAFFFVSSSTATGCTGSPNLSALAFLFKSSDFFNVSDPCNEEPVPNLQPFIFSHEMFRFV